MDNKKQMTDELLPIKSSRKKPKVGDVFVIQPRKSLYFYGKVIKTDIQAINPFLKGKNTVLIYKKVTSELKVPDNLNVNTLLIPPQIVDFGGWTKGFFFTVGNLELTNEEINLDYGFKDTRMATECYRSEEGDELNHKPSIIGIYAVGSYGSVAYKVTKALEKHPELLDV
ncbi:immunity 26/phosphotriesterase HocA family protein [Methanosarcina sp. T3]|uniref:immunity 26/phosphotriesterase HocA family protein n=1 Tax=Methanosarcina sp. T3 TaxID=3439062 RepID=UPI003F829E2D